MRISPDCFLFKVIKLICLTLISSRGCSGDSLVSACVHHGRGRATFEPRAARAPRGMRSAMGREAQGVVLEAVLGSRWAALQAGTLLSCVEGGV